MNPRRTLKDRLSTRRALLGLLLTRHDPTFSEIAAMCGYDFLILDGEHGVFGEEAYIQTLQTLAGSDTLAMVRLAKHDTQALGRYLDMGADAIIVPNVSTPEQAGDLARAMEYPPRGTRGFGASLHRATRYGMDLAAHLNAPRQGACLLVIIESARGVANAESILGVEGVDGVIIGPWDLSADLGCPGDFSQPAYSQAIAHVEQAAMSQRKFYGTVPHGDNSLPALVSRGHRLLIIGADVSLICEAMRADLDRARSCIPVV